jgi:hypothetical protein
MTDPFNPAEEETFEREERRRWPKWLFLLLGLALGLAAGLMYTWILNPVQFYNTDPVDLHPQHKETWILLVAATYRQDGDLDRAISRLARLEDPNIGQTVANITDQAIRAGRSATRIRALAALADALGARSDQMMIYFATPEPTFFFTATPMPPTPTDTPLPPPTSTPTTTPAPTTTPTATSTPTSIPTPRPTITRRPTATRPPPYYLERRQRICQSDRDAPRIEVIVQTIEGAGIPGIEIWVTWSGGVDRFFTGLKPEMGLGYADFDMKPAAEYAVAVADPTMQVIGGLRIETCLPGEGEATTASWRLTIGANNEAFTPTPTVSPSPTEAATRTARPTATPTSTRTPRPTPTRAIVP